MATETYSHLRGASQRTQETENLLARYPRLSEQELARLIEIFPDLPPIDKAVITADDRLSGNLAAFYRDHGDKLCPSLAALSLLLFLPITAAAAALWWLFG